MNEKKLIQIISTAIGVKVNVKSKASTIDEWDSLAQLKILAALDKETKGKSSKISELNSLDTVTSFIKILKNKKLLK